MPEADLYPAVKAFLARQGYDVKGEVRGCDVVATRGAEAPVIVELKLAFNLALVLQGIDRLALTDRVYLAVARRPRKQIRDLCRRVGMGLMMVTGRHVDVLVDPGPYRPRKYRKKLTRLLGEHAHRAGDPNPGGLTRTPLMTAYRQEACRCALLIDRAGRASLRTLRATGLVPNASKILQRDVYGWFRRFERATYELTDRARHDLARFTAAGVLPAL